jgi:PBSX family phage portal protein
MATFRKVPAGWRAEVCVNGVRKSKVRPTKTEARNWAAQAEFELGQMADGVSTTHTLGAVFEKQLNEGATLFRRKYYQNGSHAGFILYMTDTAQKQEDVDNLRKALKDAKGPGNFRNLFMYAPNGKKDGIQLLPVSEVAAKDDFWNIKRTSRDDQLAGHRVPPQLMGIVPENTGGFGDARNAATVFVANELEPLQLSVLELNEIVGEEVIKFNPYSLDNFTAPGN